MPPVPPDRFSVAGLDHIYKLGADGSAPSAAPVKAPAPAGAATTSSVPGDLRGAAAAASPGRDDRSVPTPRPPRKGTGDQLAHPGGEEIWAQIETSVGGRQGPGHVDRAADRPSESRREQLDEWTRDAQLDSDDERRLA